MGSLLPRDSQVFGGREGYSRLLLTLGPSIPNRAETSTPWGVTLKPVRRISKVVVVEEGDDGDLAVGMGQPKMTEGSGAPKIMVDETPKTQSVSVQKAGDGKVKSPGTDVAELFASSSPFA